MTLEFGLYAVPAMFTWGVLHKYVPLMAKAPNALIPWVNTAGYVLVKSLVPDAHADVAGAVATIPSIVGILIGGFTNSILARQLYEGFGRGLLEGLLKLKKAV